jgi:cyclic pyranopterin phosphate synthase
VRASGQLLDSHGRTIRDLRLSITDRCNFRCVYCMEPDVRFAPADSLLAPAEIVRLARLAASMGVRKIRLTGGEPTLHPHLDDIIAGIRAACDAELALITNAWRLDRATAAGWKRARLDRVTISLDSLRPERFARVTRSGCTPAAVLAGVEACLAEGLTPVKLNAVLMRGFNDDEAADLAGLARELGVEMRFIEYMPLDSAHAWDPSRVVTASETRRAIDARYPLVPTGDDDPSSTSANYRFADGAPGRIGFIAPVSNPFCGACSRLRLTADAKVRPCLFSTTEWDLMPLLRAGGSDDDLRTFLIDATWTKQAGHGISLEGFRQPERPMSAIGG